MMKLYTLIGPDGKPYQSETRGQFGGHKGHKGYGRLDCRSALSYLAKGQYKKYRVFFADEATAIAAGYRPCAVCMSDHYKLWKQALTLTATRQEALIRYRELIGL